VARPLHFDGVPSPRAREIMRRRPPVVSPDDHLQRAADQMTRFGVREIPVVCDGALVGIVTRSDLAPHMGQLEWTPVRLAMTPGPRTITPETPVAEVARALVEGSFNALPVLVGHALAGMVSRHDVLRHLAQLASNGC
jgi:tRNA nucleotidyltransferase (CCA-adding enzyme)